MPAQYTDWASSHPLYAALAAWLVATALHWAFAARTAADYAKMPPRLAAFLQLLGAVFGDGRKIIEAAGKLATGKTKPIVIAPTTRDVDETVDPAEAKVRSDQRGAASVVLLVIMVAAALGILLLACNPGAAASAAQAAERVEKKRVDFRSAVLQCAHDHADSCADFNACQRAVSADAGLPPAGECTDVTRAAAEDAGLLPLDDGGRK